MSQDMSQDVNRRRMGKVIAMAWTDAGFRDRLRREPDKVLTEAGVSLPQGRRVRLVEDTTDTVHVVIPTRPGHLSDEQVHSEDVHADFCKFFC